MNVRETFGEIDIYLFDQILKGRFAPGARILDAGCGGGRNLVWFLRNGFDVAAVDISADAVRHVRSLAALLAPERSRPEIEENIRVAPADGLPFPDETFDAVICSAVLHFADDQAHFNGMMEEMWRVLKPGGIFFARLAVTIGIEEKIRPLERGRYILPDGTERFLADAALLDGTAERLGGEYIDPLKTTLVRDMRSMATWALRKT